MMGEIKYSSAPYAIWSEDMLRSKLRDLHKSTPDINTTIHIEEDFFNACLFKLCDPICRGNFRFIQFGNRTFKSL